MGNDLPTQIRRCEDYCRRAGEVVERFKEEGESAKTDRTETKLTKVLRRPLQFASIRYGATADMGHRVMKFSISRYFALLVGAERR